MNEEDPRDVLKRMIVGGALGSGGSAGTNLLGKGFNKAFGAKPKYPTDEALFAAAEAPPKNIKEGKVLAEKAGKVKELRLAATEGQPGLQTLARKKEGENLAAKNYGKKKAPSPYDELLATKEAAFTPPKSMTGSLLKTGGKIVGGGESPFMRMPLAWATGGKTVLAGTGLEMSGDAMLNAATKARVEKIAADLRNAGTKGLPPQPGRYILDARVHCQDSGPFGRRALRRQDMPFDSNGTFNRVIPGGWKADATAKSRSPPSPRRRRRRLRHGALDLHHQGRSDPAHGRHSDE